MKRILYFLSFLFLLSCATTADYIIVDKSCSKFKEVAFSKDMIYKHKIGLMPANSDVMVETARRFINDVFNEEFINYYGDTAVVITDSVRKKVNDHDLTDDIIQARYEFQESGVLPKSLVAPIGEAIDARYLMFTEYGPYDFYTPKDSIHALSASVACEIWDLQEGLVVWQGIGGFSKKAECKVNGFRVTASGIAMTIGNDANQGPCQQPYMLSRNENDSKAATTVACCSASLIGLLIYAVTQEEPEP